MIEIPLSPIPGQRLQIVLDDQNVTLQLRQKGARLYIDLDVSGTPVMGGAICSDRTNVKQFKTMPFRGGLYFVDTKGRDAPQFEGLGTRWVLMYLSEEEL